MIALTAADGDFIRSLILYEDACLIAFNKPPGLSSQGGRIAVNTLDDLLGVFARSNGKRPKLVHRLDRDTSGVILTAKTQPAAAFMGKAMMARRIRKTYLAIVAPGAPSPPRGLIEAPLRKHLQGREAYMRICEPDDPKGQGAATLYRAIGATDEAALMQLAPRTGRMHQLRVHMAALGRPIAGDARYGGALVLSGLAVPRLMLHAAQLIFPHPEGGERKIEAPIPEDFARTLQHVKIEPPKGDIS